MAGKHRAPTHTTRNTAIVAFLTGGLLTLVGGGVAHADPITCPNGQVSENVKGEGWACVNGGGNTSGAAETKNPND